MKTPSEFSRGNNRGKGILEMSKMTAMEAKLDSIMHRMDKQEKKTYTAHEIGAVERELLKGSADRAVDEQFYETEEVKYLGEPRNYHFKPNTNLPTHYHPALRNYENLSYGGGASQGPRQVQNPPQGYQQPPRFQQQQQGNEHRNEYQGQRRALSFEEQMLQFMGDNKKLLNLHEQKFAELGATATSFQVFQNTTNATLKNLETQVGQLLGYGQNIQFDWNINAAEFKNFYPLTHQGSHAFHKNRRKGKRNLPLADRFVKPSKSASWFVRIFKGAAFLKSDHPLQVSTHEQIINDLLNASSSSSSSKRN